MHTTIMLQKAISSGIQYWLGLKAGLLKAANGSCLFESLDTCSDEDETKAIDLVESVKLGEYML